jgi:hypothetical protein
MKLDRDRKRTVAQFLNGLAVALSSALVVVPLVSGSFDVVRTVARVMAAAVLHAAAITLSAR